MKKGALKNKETGLIKVILIGQIKSWKFGFVISELVVGSGEQDASFKNLWI